MDELTTPKPRWPLHLHETVGKIEQTTRRLLEDCASNGGHFGIFLDVVKVTNIMRASAVDSFRAGAEYYESQPGFCRQWLDEVADETLDATFDLVPPGIIISRRYKNSVTSIAEKLRAELHAALQLRAEAWARAAEGGFPKANQAGETEPSGDRPAQERPARAPNAGTRKRRRDLVKRYRTEETLTMADLAKRAGTCVTAIQGMVRGDRSRYGDETLSRFLKTIGVSTEQW